jgi:hypothetical protein
MKRFLVFILELVSFILFHALLLTAFILFCFFGVFGVVWVCLFFFPCFFFKSLQGWFLLLQAWLVSSASGLSSEGFLAKLSKNFAPHITTA